MIGVVLSNVGSIVGITKAFASSKDGLKFLPTQGSTDQVPINMMTHVAAERTSAIMLECVSAGIQSLGNMQIPTTSKMNSTIHELGTHMRFKREIYNLWNSSLIDHDLCALVPSYVNQDVGGIGVSYLRTTQRASSD